jgi:transcriptional regulator with XRE-family HTH domain
MRFGHFIRTRRTEAGFGLREFARKVGISATYQSRIETGHFPSPSIEIIIKMSEILNGDADFFLAMGDKIHPDTNEAIIDTMGLWSHFIRKNPRVVFDYMEKAKRKLENEIS